MDGLNHPMSKGVPYGHEIIEMELSEITKKKKSLVGEFTGLVISRTMYIFNHYYCSVTLNVFSFFMFILIQREEYLWKVN